MVSDVQSNDRPCVVAGAGDAATTGRAGTDLDVQRTSMQSRGRCRARRFWRTRAWALGVYCRRVARCCRAMAASNGRRAQRYGGATASCLVAGGRVAGSVAVLLSHTVSLAGRRFTCRRRSGGLVERGAGQEHRTEADDRASSGWPTVRARQSAAGQPCSQFRQRARQPHEIAT
jgi:hypothetical protein